MASSIIKVGLAGFGYSASIYHLPFIAAEPDLELVAIYQRSPPPLPGSSEKHCTTLYPQCRHYMHLEDFIADKEIDLVVIATADSVHAEIAIKALRAGKHGMPSHDID